VKKKKYTVTFIDEISCRTSNYRMFEIKFQWNGNEKVVRIKIPRRRVKEKLSIDMKNMNDEERKKIYAHALLEIKDSIRSLETDNELKVMFNYKDPFVELSSIGWSAEDFLNRKPLEC